MKGIWQINHDWLHVTLFFRYTIKTKKTNAFWKKAGCRQRYLTGTRQLF